MPSYVVDAFADPNLASPTVTVAADHVTDTQEPYDFSYQRETEMLPTFYVRGANLPPPGLYTAEMELLDPHATFAISQVFEGHIETTDVGVHDDALVLASGLTADRIFLLASAHNASRTDFPAVPTVWTRAEHASLGPAAGPGAGTAQTTGFFAETAGPPVCELSTPTFLNAALAAADTVTVKWLIPAETLHGRSYVAFSLDGLESGVGGGYWSNDDGKVFARATSAAPSVTLPETSRTYTRPGHARSGVLIALLGYDNAGDPGFTVDAGWTLAGEHSPAAASQGVAVYYKLIDPSDGDYTFSGTLGSSAAWEAKIFCYLRSRPLTFSLAVRNGHHLHPESLPRGGGWSPITGGERVGYLDRVLWTGPSFIPVVAGDELAFKCFGGESGNPGDLTAQIAAVRFTSVDETGAPADPIGGEAGAPIDLLGPPVSLGGGDLINTPPTDIRFDPGDFTDANYVAACITDDGTLWVVWFEGGFSSSQNLGMKKWDGAAWSTVTDDISGHGPFGVPLGTEEGLSMDTDGTDLWIAWVERDGTAVSSGFSTHYNLVWRVKKYVPATDTWTELGSSSGQRAHAVHTTTAASILLPRLKVGPDGKVWVGWQEADDVATSDPAYCMRPFLWWYSAGSWHDSAIPDPPMPAGATGYLTNFIAFDGWGVEFAFRNKDGPSAWPSAIYNADWIGASDPSQDAEYVYHEFDGAAWTLRHNFQPHDVWSEMNLPGTVPAGAGSEAVGRHWPQGGIWLFEVAGELWFFTSIFGQGGNFGNALESRSSIARLRADGTFERLPEHTFYDPQLIMWSDPTGCWPALDGDGNLFVRATTNEVLFGDLILTRQEDGTHDGWTSSVEQLAPLPDPAHFNPGPVLFDGSTCYVVLCYYDYDTGDTPLVVWKMERETYEPWAPSSEIPPPPPPPPPPSKDFAVHVDLREGRGG